MDYRRLNAMIVKNKYPFPVIDELLDELHGACWFSSLDLCYGFHQIKLAKGEEPKTAFETHEGHYEYQVMPYGVIGVPTTFQGIMNKIMSPLLRKYVVVFIDDVLIYSSTWQDHLLHIEEVFKLLQQNQLYVKLTKCSFARQTLNYLGHVISPYGVSTDT